MAFIEPDPEVLRLTVVPAPKEPPVTSEEYQKELRDLIASMRASGLKPSIHIRGIDAAAGSGPAIIDCITLAGFAALHIIRPFLLELLKGPNGRKVRLEIGNFKGEAQTTKEIAELMDLAEKYEQHQHPKIIP